MKYKILGLIAAAALSGSAFAQTGGSDAANPGTTTNTQQTDTRPHHNYGWIGLLGLAGLIGLRRQDHTRTVNTATGTTRQ